MNILLALACRYLQGERPLLPSQLAVQLNLPDALVMDEVDRLIAAGMVGMVKEPEGVSLIKLPELITAQDILDTIRVGSPMDISPPIDLDDPVETLLRRRDDAVSQSLAGHTLRSLALERMAVKKRTHVTAEPLSSDPQFKSTSHDV